ncbi:MAG: hypothetical protein AABW75_05065 [Nanoarchaeota archaeon]
MCYWSENKKEVLEEARATLEYFFDISLSLSDRMFLKKYVTEFIDELDRSNFENRMSINPIYEAVGKFLMIHYNFRDINKIARGCNGYISNTVNRKLREKGYFIESFE